MNALLLSAGLGTRFRPVTDRVAKPAIPFLNVPLLGYSLYYLENLGLHNLVFNTHHLPSSVEGAARCLTHEREYRVSFSHEPKILGSGGGILKARSALEAGASSGGDFIVCNADEVLLFNHTRGLAPLVEFHKSSGALATLLTTDHPEAGKALGGVWVADGGVGGKIIKLGGQGSEPGARHFTGVYVFSPRIFDYMPSDGEFHIFKDCLHKAMAAGEKVLAFHDATLTWLDMSSEKDYISSTRAALEILSALAPDDTAGARSGADNDNLIKAQNLKNILNRFHQNFEIVADHMWLCSGAKFSGELESSSYLFMGADSEVGHDVKVKGFGVLGAGAKFIQGVIDHSVIAPGVHVNPVTSLRNEIVI